MPDDTSVRASHPPPLTPVDAPRRSAPALRIGRLYFDGATFQAWDDIIPPRIRISADGQMAYVVVEKRVHVTTRGASGATETERVRYAWLSIYEKRNGAWRMTAIASTDRPDST